MFIKRNTPKSKSRPHCLNRHPQLPRKGEKSSFAQQMAASVLHKNYVAPEDRDFVDHEPPKLTPPELKRNAIEVLLAKAMP